MKLYTEEQVKKVIKDSFLEGIERNTNYESVKKSIFNSLITIELPSDEEIWNAADKEESNSKHYAFTRGARYVIDKIQGGNK